MVGIRQHVDIHKQLCNDSAEGVAMIAMRMQIADYGKGYVSQEHQSEQLGIVIPCEG